MTKEQIQELAHSICLKLNIDTTDKNTIKSVLRVLAMIKDYESFMAYIDEHKFRESLKFLSPYQRFEKLYDDYIADLKHNIYIANLERNEKIVSDFQNKLTSLYGDLELDDLDISATDKDYTKQKLFTEKLVKYEIDILMKAEIPIKRLLKACVDYDSLTFKQVEQATIDIIVRKPLANFIKEKQSYSNMIEHKIKEIVDTPQIELKKDN